MRSGWVCRPLCVFLRFRCRVGLCVVAWRAWSGWVRRPLCLHLRLPCGVGLHYARGAGAEWLGMSASPRSLVSSQWGRIALCSSVGLSALACVFPVGSNFAVLAEPARSGWARRPLCVRLCPLLRGRIAPLVCLLVVYMFVAAAGAAARRASSCSSRRPESVCVRLPRLRPVPLPSPLSLPPPPPPLGCCLLLCVPCLPP